MPQWIKYRVWFEILWRLSSSTRRFLKKAGGHIGRNIVYNNKEKDNSKKTKNKLNDTDYQASYIKKKIQINNFINTIDFFFFPAWIHKLNR